MTRGEINLIPSKLEERRKLSLNLGTQGNYSRVSSQKQIEIDRSVYDTCSANMHGKCL